VSLTQRFRVLDVVPFAEEDESPFVGMLLRCRLWFRLIDSCGRKRNHRGNNVDRLLAGSLRGEAR
jgi:hypothetical protein